jgi:transposase
MTVEERNQALGMIAAGCTRGEVAAAFGRSRQCIGRLIMKYNTTRSVQDKPRSGRPHILSRRQEKMVYRTARRNLKIEYEQLANTTVLISHNGTPSKLPSRSTLYRVLKRHSLTNYRAKKRLKLTRGHALARLRFCRTWINFLWHRRTLKFLDECTVEKGTGQNQEWAFRFLWET